MKNKALVTVHMAPIFVNVPSFDNKTKCLGSLNPTCEHFQHHSHVSYMFPLLTFLICYICVVHIERSPLSSNHYSQQNVALFMMFCNDLWNRKAQL